MKDNVIFIRGAREHNLKNIDASIPKNKLVAITGVSGSGKSSLAFDTIFAEGQRRYITSLASHTKQFMYQIKKPDVDQIDGLPPTLSIEQKASSNNPRSTVGTITEIYDYLRLLYAKIGRIHCPKCGKIIKKHSIDAIVDEVMAMQVKTKFMIAAPLQKDNHVSLESFFEALKRDGFIRVMKDGMIHNLDDMVSESNLTDKKACTVQVIVDRLTVKAGIEKRVYESCETAMHLSGGYLEVYTENGELKKYSQKNICPDCKLELNEIEPKSFSFNSHIGACRECMGLGVKRMMDEKLIVPDRSLSILQGAITATGFSRIAETGRARRIMDSLANTYQFDLNDPFGQLPPKVQYLLMNGTDECSKKYAGEYPVYFEGMVAHLERRYRETGSEALRAEYESYMRSIPCKYCNGQRLNKEALSVTINGKNISQLCELTAIELNLFLGDLRLTANEKTIAEQLLSEITSRTKCLIDIGLDYLTLSRPVGTLSGGELQRVRLITQLGSGVVGVVYILDEPSIGMHAYDCVKLLNILKELKRNGNSVLVVEHNSEVIRNADYIIDIGPGAGNNGGNIVAEGALNDVLENDESLTGAYLSGKIEIPIPIQRRIPSRFLVIKGAKKHNLKNIDVRFPLGVVCCVTGVSGSGKSSLVTQTLYQEILTKLRSHSPIRGDFESIEGLESVDKVISIDQSPIGKSPRSNPATYTGIFDYIRELFATCPEARRKGYDKGRFSFNVPGGRCENCQGDGMIKVDMQFLPDVYIPCEICRGKRYNRETLSVLYKGKSIYDVLEMTVEQAMEFFKNIPYIYKRIKPLYDVGLSYVKLGQSAVTLSGGEAQRIKLASELSRPNTGSTVYLFDEPTTGLHFADIHKLIKIFHQLCESGNTVFIIEHDLDVIKCADYVIDLGPNGGELGGKIVTEGTPEHICKCKDSYTGRFLSKKLYV